MTREERYKHVLAWLGENYPDAATELHYDSPFGLLVSVILSAQCTDKRVNMVAPALLERYPTPQAMAQAAPEDIYPYIKSISYPNNKAKNLSNMAKELMEFFGGIIPDDVDRLQRLSGVGRKTANVILSVVYKKPAMAVDTHVFRVAARIGLTVDAKTPLEAERQLVNYIPEELLAAAHHWLLLHGRYVCTARNPNQNECGLAPWCKKYAKDRKKRSTPQ